MLSLFCRFTDFLQRVQLLYICILYTHILYTILLCTVILQYSVYLFITWVFQMFKIFNGKKYMHSICTYY